MLISSLQQSKEEGEWLYCIYLGQKLGEIFMLRSTKGFMIVFLLSVVFIAFASTSAKAQGYMHSVIAEDVEVQYLRGEMRFCERKDLRGITCGFMQNLFGKKRFAARDWWSPETYIRARTGLNEFTLYGVEATPDGRSLVIYYAP